MSIYLDYNASAPIDPDVLDVMIDVYKNYIGNADSRTHEFGDRARTIVETSRKQVASLLGITPSEVFFTSGATESNNIAIQGLEKYALESGKNHIITSSIEHKAVLETVKRPLALAAGSKQGRFIYHAVTDNFIHCEIISNRILEANKMISIRITNVLEDRIKKGGDIEASAEFI